MKNNPPANFAGLEGSRGPSRTQSQANRGASRITKMACTATNQLDGKVNPRTESRV